MVTLANGGGILSNADFTAPFEVVFSFAFVGSTYDSFRVLTRVDDFFPAGYSVQNGVGVSFRIKSDTGNSVGNIALEDNGLVLATATIALTTNTFYTGRLIDTGSELEFYWGLDSTPLITASTNSHYGDKIASFNREGAGNRSSISAGSMMAIDSIAVIGLRDGVHVPETGSTILLFGLGLFGLVNVRRKLLKVKC